jgi:hypothetical protein
MSMATAYIYIDLLEDIAVGHKENMKRMRRRRIYGRRSVPVEVDQAVIDSLVTLGFLKPGSLRPGGLRPGRRHTNAVIGRRINAAIGAAVSKWLREHRLYTGTGA